MTKTPLHVCQGDVLDTKPSLPACQGEVLDDSLESSSVDIQLALMVGNITLIAAPGFAVPPLVIGGGDGGGTDVGCGQDCPGGVMVLHS